jgi:hypothetical protein
MPKMKRTKGERSSGKEKLPSRKISDDPVPVRHFRCGIPRWCHASKRDIAIYEAEKRRRLKTGEEYA